MNTIRRNALFLLLFSLLSFSTSAQQVSTELQPGYWTFGLNAGKAYQSSDVRATTEGYGFGLTLGKNVFYRPGAPLSLDLRSRLLYARSKGLDPFKTFSIDKNSALNGQFDLDYRQLPEALGGGKGFVFSNYQTDLAELGGEAVVTLNQLKENTGIKVSLYGGLGLDWYQVKVDQANGQGEEYFEGYQNLNDRAPTNQVLKTLKSEILDGNYESYADEFQNGWGKMNLMPSVGAEVGFQVTPKFSIDFGHKLTFSRTDLLDGNQWKDNSNDLHHYTYAGLNFNINKKEKQFLLPFITITEPYGNALSTDDRSVPVRATIKNIDRSSDVIFRVNGISRSFSFRNEQFFANVGLQPGENELIISASNPAGNDSERLIIFYRDRVVVPPPPPQPPVVYVYPPRVEIIFPAPNGFETEQAALSLEAKTSYVDSERELEVWLNGTRIDFNFQRSRQLLNARLNLREGENRIVIRATNRYGRDEASTLVYRERMDQRPIVQITQPANQSETSSQTTKLVANVKYISNPDNLKVLVNGKSRGNFDFQNGLLTTNVSLESGYNTIEVRAENRAGYDSDQVTVYWKPVAPQLYPPEVRIVQPQNQAVTEVASVKLVASVSEVRTSEGIEVFINGKSTRSFSFNGREVLANVSLEEGNNLIRVKATNADGADEETVTVKYTRPIAVEIPQYPEVRIILPTPNSFSRQPTVELKAEVLHVSNKSDVEIRVNNSRAMQFVFNKQVATATITLQKGSNIIQVIGKNEDGMDEASVVVTYQKDEMVELGTPPVITIKEPADKSTFETDRINIRALIKGIDQTSDVSLWINGKEVKDFQFENGTLNGTIRLGNGSNILVVKATNKWGNTDASVTVRYIERTLAPTVKILDPSNNSQIDLAMISFKAHTSGVKENKEIELKLNRKSVNFRFDPESGMVTSSLPLTLGSNAIEITAKNKGGLARDEVKILYRLPKEEEVSPVIQPNVKNKPTIRIQSVSQPTIDPMNPNRARSTIIATIDEVGGEKDIAFFVNNIQLSDFDYDSKTTTFQATFFVQPGDNQVRIRASNSAGTTEIATTVTLGVKVGDNQEEVVNDAEPVKDSTIKPAPSKKDKVGEEQIIQGPEIRGKEKATKIKRRW